MFETDDDDDLSYSKKVFMTVDKMLVGLKIDPKFWDDVRRIEAEQGAGEAACLIMRNCLIWKL